MRSLLVPSPSPEPTSNDYFSTDTALFAMRCIAPCSFFVHVARTGMPDIGHHGRGGVVG
jgi:hypothetical protein